MQRDDFEVMGFPGLDAVGQSDSASALRVAIVTEEILGPVRNGGIASTYYHLAKGLAAHGHEVHVLFLKGPVVQDETPEHWVRHYADFGVTLHYLQTPTETAWGASASWQRRFAGAYDWLRDQEPFDVVHTSEWRGGLVYALMAKRLGLAFRDTLFVVKTSSPYIWNRHYQMQPITQPDLLVASYAEQKCVELADAVVGGSAHLISFMDRIGYRLPKGHVYVQPNIVDFSNVAVADIRPGRRREQGDIVKSRDLVFFGRLESRKGIEIFCRAVDLLHERGTVPDSVTFLGKWSGRLPAQGDITPEEYVNEKAPTWRCPVTTVTDKNQPEALSYLCERDVIAVMPSLIENSSMAIYELLEQRVPFIASAVGGSPELVAEEDHADCLVEPTAEALADRLERVLEEGQVIARSRFSNDDNLRVWYGFHAHVGAMIAEHGHSRVTEQFTEGVEGGAPPVDSLCYAALVRRGESLEPLVKALHAGAPDLVALAFTDASARAEIERAREALSALPTTVTVVNCLGRTAGAALNLLVEAQGCDAVVVSDGVGVLPREGFFDAAQRGLSHRPGCLFTTFFTTDEMRVGMPLGGDVASQVRGSRAYGPETVALRPDTITDIGGFESYDARRGIVHEFVTRAAEAGHDLLVFPEPLLAWPDVAEDVKAFQSDPLYSYLKAKALIDDSGLAQRKVVLATLHGAGGTTGGVEERLLRGPGAEGTQSHWLMPATWDPEVAEPEQHRRLIVGLDAERDELWLYARGVGERRLLVRGEESAVETVVEHGSEGSEDYLTLSTFAVPSEWEAGSSYPIIWGLYDGEDKLRNVFFRVNKIAATTFALAARNPVLSAGALTALVERRTMVAPDLTVRDLGLPRPSHAESVADDSPGSGADPTEEYVNQAVTAARRLVRRRGHLDPVRATMVNRYLWDHPPPRTPLPVMPRSGLSSPHDRDGWVEGDWLRGWAWDRENRQRMVHVAVVAEGEPRFMARADGVDPSLDEVPGRDLHAFSIPVMPEFLTFDQLQLEIWEGREPVFRGALYVDREGEPMLRRLPPAPAAPPGEAMDRRKRRRWWSRR